MQFLLCVKLVARMKFDDSILLRVIDAITECVIADLLQLLISLSDQDNDVTQAASSSLGELLSGNKFDLFMDFSKLQPLSSESLQP